MNLTKKYILANFIQDLFNDNLYYQNTSGYVDIGGFEIEKCREKKFYQKGDKLYKLVANKSKFKNLEFQYLKPFGKGNVEKGKNYIKIGKTTYIGPYNYFGTLKFKDRYHTEDVMDFTLIDFVGSLKIVLNVPGFEEKVMYEREDFDGTRNFGTVYDFFFGNNQKYLKIVKN